MRFYRVFPMAWLAGILVSLLTGCGSTSSTVMEQKSTGTQLLELKEAHDKGVINDKEYERMRKRIVREND